VHISDIVDAIVIAYALSMIPGWPGVVEPAHEHLRPGSTPRALTGATRPV
jgi:hypothetical protein